MSCDPADTCLPAGPSRRDRRSLAGWLLLLPLIAMLVLYGFVALLIADPPSDEAYRRTFLAAEFSVFPTSDSWKPGNGLDYSAGTYVDFHDSDMRKWLARLDWLRVDTPNVTLRGARGRVFLHLTGEADPAARRHRLTLQLVCHLSVGHAGGIEVTVNGHAAGTGDCGEGPVTIEADLPPGRLGVQFYDEITITRDEGSFIETIATRLGFRAQAVELVGLELDAG